MGDIIDMKITIHGHIGTAAAFKALAEAMAADLEQYDDVSEARQALLDANLEDKGLVISAEAYNGTVSAMTEAARKHKIDMTVYSAEGPGWGASTYFVRNGIVSQELPVIDGEIAVTTQVIDKLMARGLTELSQLRSYIDIFKSADDQPNFNVSDEVISTMFIPKRSR